MSSSRKRALSIDGAERGDGGGRSSERQGKLSRKRKVTVAETEKQGRKYKKREIVGSH